MSYMLIIAAVMSAAILGFVGMLVYASPNPMDQLAGRLIMAAAAAILVMTFFHRDPHVALILKVILVLTLLGTLWLLGRMFSFL